MKQVFDLIEAIEEAVARHEDRNGAAPTQISFSPASYQHLVRLKAADQLTGVPVSGCEAIRVFQTSTGPLTIVIDEMLSDTIVETT